MIEESEGHISTGVAAQYNSALQSLLNLPEGLKVKWGFGFPFLAILRAVLSEGFLGLLSLTSTFPVNCDFLITLQTEVMDT